MLSRLAYISQLNETMTPDKVDAMVAAAAANNAANNITGIIAFENSKVCQIIEGEREPLDALFSKIRMDSRHSGVTLLDQGDVETRHFPDWGMVRRPMVDIVMLASHVVPADVEAA